jgi:hypothetical protein
MKRGKKRKLSIKAVKKVRYQVKQALVKRADIKNFRPTIAQAQSWFNILNKGLFTNMLEMPEIRVERMRGALGECVCTWNARKIRVPQDQLPTKFYPSKDVKIHIRLKPIYRTWKEFIETLAHEMVHLYQMTVLKCPYSNHNADFYAWRNKFKMFGLGLSQ